MLPTTVVSATPSLRSGPLVLEDGECDDVELADDGKELEDDEWVVPEHTNCIADGSTPNARE